jgi:Flp pilus assembly protein TadD
MTMRKKAFSTMLASAAILGSSMVGCSGAGLDHRPALRASAAAATAPRVEQALASRDYARALMQAEELVAAVPNDAGHRALLGRAYLANGRYASARTAFADALALGNRDVRTIVSLALCETGLGNAAGARALLTSHIAHLPAGDYGLAMAMAGDPNEGVRALLEAVRQPEATAQTRQNLAYALALGGAWGQARLVAGQDLTAREAEQRIGQWSQAQAAGAEQRVAGLIGVAPRGDDAGLPVRLALGVTPVAPVQTASATHDLAGQARAELAATPVAAPAPSPPLRQPAEPVRVAMASPDSLAIAKSFEAARAADVPLVRASSDPMREAVRAAFQRSSASGAQALAMRAGMSRIVRQSAPAPDAQASDWVVQIGAFDSAAVAQEKWRRISRNRAALGDFREVHSAFTLNGRAFHRLAVRGFTDRASANALCASLRKDGQSCFVRLDDTDSTRLARAAARATTKTAQAKPVGSAPRIAAR